MKAFRTRCNLLRSALLIFLSLLVAALPAAETVTYYHTDALGSIVAATDEQGAVLWRESYRPYGERIDRTVPTSDHRLFYTGKPHDDATGFTYFGARYYDPLVGRFIGMDPVGVDPVNHYAFNRYSYANNNPYKYIDPDGRSVYTKLFKLLWKGGDVAQTFAGTFQDVYVLTGTAAPWSAKAEVLANLASEILPVSIRDVRDGIDFFRAAKGAPDITKAYKRPSGATTVEQRASVQGKPCVDYGAVTPKQVADHKNPLVKEYYETGTIDTTWMRSVDAVQPQCPTCSARQGADMSRYSQQLNR